MTLRPNDYDKNGDIIPSGWKEEKGDLISRSRLRKNMEFICMGIMAGTEPYNAPLTEIDNAPTVEPCYQTASCLDCKNYDKDKHACPRYCEVIKDALRSVSSERPKGKWEKIEPYPLQMHEFKCSECGYETDDCTDNFCSYCGADMRKKEGDNK